MNTQEILELPESLPPMRQDETGLKFLESGPVWLGGNQLNEKAQFQPKHWQRYTTYTVV